MALKFEFNIDAKKFMYALREYPDELSNAARVGIKERLVKVQTRAAIIHRYTASRSSNLSKAFELDMINNFTGELILSKGISNAPYAHAIHDGRKDWPNYKPDQFLYDAFEYYQEKEPFADVCKDIINNALRKARLT